VRVPLEEALLGTRARGVEVLALDDPLASLAKRDPRKARVIELRFFGGLSVEETAELLRISPETVLRDWKMAKSGCSASFPATARPPPYARSLYYTVCTIRCCQASSRDTTTSGPKTRASNSFAAPQIFLRKARERLTFKSPAESVLK
jgi:hypothetical protein